MRRIINDKAFKRKAAAFSRSLFKSRRRGFFTPAIELDKLKNEADLKKNYKLPDQVIIEYIEHIELNYKKIISASERRIEAFIKEFDTILAGNPMTPEFSKAVAGAMRYDALRDKEYPEFMRRSKLKTCCYCHSQSTIVFETLADSTLKAHFQLDHKYPQSIYPFLATTFYNLYPICGNCNQAKSNKPSGFELYTEGLNLDLLHFGLKDKSIAKYWKTGKAQDLKIIITPAIGEEKMVKSYLEMFKIEEIYNMQIDIAEELVHKQRVYNGAYKETLVHSFKALFPDQSMINRLIIGNYDRPEEMMQRPTAKFVQEIARDVGLIPKI